METTKLTLFSNSHCIYEDMGDDIYSSGMEI